MCWCLILDIFNIQKKNTQLQKRYKKYALVTFDYRVACLCITKRHGLLQDLASQQGWKTWILLKVMIYWFYQGSSHSQEVPATDQTLTLGRTRESCYCWGPLYMGPPQARSLFVFTCSKRDQIKGQAFEGCCDFLTAPRSASGCTPTPPRRGGRGGRRTGAAVAGRVQLAAYYVNISTRSWKCSSWLPGIDLSVLWKSSESPFDWIFVWRNASKYDWCLALRTLPSFRTTNRNTKPNHQWCKVACHCISDIKSINHYKVASTVALAEWFARHEDLHMNIWRSMPIWLVQTKRSHWSTWQGKLHSSRSSNVNCCYGHSRESRVKGTYFASRCTLHTQPLTAPKLHFQVTPWRR